MRTTLLGEPPRRRPLQPGARRRGRRAVRVGAGLSGRARRPPRAAPRPGRSPARCPRPTASRTGLRRTAGRAAHPARVAGRAAARATSSPSRACSRRSPRAWATSVSLEPAPSRSCIRVAPPRSPSAARAPGWIGELHPAVAREWDLPGGTAFELDVAPLFAAAPSGEELYEDVTTHPAVLQDLAVVVPEDVPAERVRSTVDDAGGELLRSVRDLRPLSRRPGRRRAGRASRCGSSSGRRTGPSPTRRSRGAARRSHGPWRRSGARSVPDQAKARVLVAGASGFSGALAARLVWGHPAPGARGDHLAQRGRHAAGRDLPAPPRAADARGARPRGLDGVDAAIVAYPHGAAAPLVAELRDRRRGRGRPLGRLPPARPGRVRALVRRARRAGRCSTGRSTA